MFSADSEVSAEGKAKKKKKQTRFIAGLGRTYSTNRVAPPAFGFEAGISTIYVIFKTGKSVFTTKDFVLTLRTASYILSPSMRKKTLNPPTKAEIRILQILWRLGPSTVRRVHEELGEAGGGYTSALKVMQIMLEKGFLSRNDQNRTHVYAAAVPEAEAKRGLVRDLMERAF